MGKTADRPRVSGQRFYRLNGCRDHIIGDIRIWQPVADERFASIFCGDADLPESMIL